MSNSLPIIFADGITSVRLANGVVRISLGSLDAENKLQNAGTLVVPVAQFHPTVRNLANAVNDLIAKARDAQAQGQAQPAVSTEATGPDAGDTSPPH